MKRWVDLAKIEHTFEGFCELLLREQLLDTSSKDFEVFLKEHSCRTAEELARLSDRYLEAHGGRKRTESSKRFRTDARNQQQMSNRPGTDKEEEVKDGGEGQATRRNRRRSEPQW